MAGRGSPWLMSATFTCVAPFFGARLGRELRLLTYIYTRRLLLISERWRRRPNFYGSSNATPESFASL